MALLWAAILSYPAPWPFRLQSLRPVLSGMQPATLAWLVSQYSIGEYSASPFDLAHHHLPETFTIQDGVVLLGVWSRLAERRRAAAA